MYSREHAVLSALVGAPIAAGFSDIQQSIFFWAFFVAIGVGIDFDHFVIARLNRGDWTNLRRCVRDPARVFVDQGSIFDDGDVWRDQRLLSHLLVGGTLATLVWPIGRYAAFGVAVAIYTHVLADLYSDIRTRDEYLSEVS